MVIKVALIGQDPTTSILLMKALKASEHEIIVVGDQKEADAVLACNKLKECYSEEERKNFEELLDNALKDPFEEMFKNIFTHINNIKPLEKFEDPFYNNKTDTPFYAQDKKIHTKLNSKSRHYLRRR